jgi:hypothetical protein
MIVVINREAVKTLASRSWQVKLCDQSERFAECCRCTSNVGKLIEPGVKRAWSVRDTLLCVMEDEAKRMTMS